MVKVDSFVRLMHSSSTFPVALVVPDSLSNELVRFEAHHKGYILTQRETELEGISLYCGTNINY